MRTNHPLSQEEFDSIYSKVPRLTVEIIIKNQHDGLYLTKRAIEPCRGQWHLPGGTVRFGEKLKEAVERIAQRELGVVVNESKNVGYIEYPSHFEYGLDCPVGIVFEITSYSGLLRTNNEAENGGWFNKCPKLLHSDQDKFLIQNKYLV